MAIAHNIVGRVARVLAEQRLSAKPEHIEHAARAGGGRGVARMSKMREPKERMERPEIGGVERMVRAALGEA